LLLHFEEKSLCIVVHGDVNLEYPYVIRVFYEYESRAASREELQKILDAASLRERVIITIMATGGFREGTLSKLQYRHLKHDLENHIVPVHVPVEAGITKGKYRSYYTFLNQEATDYLTAYLNARRIGTEKVAPEEIRDDSPLIRAVKGKIKPLNEERIQSIIHDLYFKAGLIVRSNACKRYALRTHSLRKFFQPSSRQEELTATASSS
jgi:hypothetical protein